LGPGAGGALVPVSGKIVEEAAGKPRLLLPVPAPAPNG
jgi:hypothetical protein